MTRHRHRLLLLALATFAALVSRAALAQSTDTVRLGDLQRAALRADQRSAQARLLSEQSRLRLRSIDRERLPTVSVLGMAQYLSDVPSVAIPGGPPAPPHDNYDANVALRQRLYDPVRNARRVVERARLGEAQARLDAALRGQRDAVLEAFFALLRLDAERATTTASITALEALRAGAAERLAAGTALPSEVAAIDAELLRRRQAINGIDADRDAAREVLGSLAGAPIAPGALLAMPEYSPEMLSELARATRVAGDARFAAELVRPERERFARGRDLLAAQRGAIAAQERPRLSAFARTGYGRPGLNPLATDFDTYWLAGVQVEWSPLDWGARDRDAEELELQAEILVTEEAAFVEALGRAVTRDAAIVRRLEQALVADDSIVALHRAIDDESRLRFTEGVITSAEYIDRQSDLLMAELARATHRVQLAEARSRLLTTLGREIH